MSFLQKAMLLFKYFPLQLTSFISKRQCFRFAAALWIAYHWVELVGSPPYSYFLVMNEQISNMFCVTAPGWKFIDLHTCLMFILFNLFSFLSKRRLIIFGHCCSYLPEEMRNPSTFKCNSLNSFLASGSMQCQSMF